MISDDESKFDVFTLAPSAPILLFKCESSLCYRMFAVALCYSEIRVKLIELFYVSEKWHK